MDAIMDVFAKLANREKLFDVLAVYFKSLGFHVEYPTNVVPLVIEVYREKLDAEPINALTIRYFDHRINVIRVETTKPRRLFHVDMLTPTSIDQIELIIKQWLVPQRNLQIDYTSAATGSDMAGAGSAS